MKFFKQKLSPPYKNGKPVFKLRNIGGVYIIYEKGKIVYVGYSRTNLYRTLYRHFSKWNDSQYRVVYSPKDENIKVKVIYTKASYMAKVLEQALILQHKPKDNENLYDDFEADDKEKQALKEFNQAPENDIVQYKGEINF
jgi:hypothetical protein